MDPVIALQLLAATIALAVVGLVLNKLSVRRFDKKYPDLGEIALDTGHADQVAKRRSTEGSQENAKAVANENHLAAVRRGVTRIRSLNAVEAEERYEQLLQREKNQSIVEWRL